MRLRTPPPRTFKIMGRPIRVTLTDHYIETGDASALGLTESDDQTVLLCTIAGEDKRREVYLHEVMHVIFDAAGLSDTISHAQDESVINRTAPILLQFLTDNPSVYTYLTGRGTYR